jgi:hypothetical protein
VWIVDGNYTVVRVNGFELSAQQACCRAAGMMTRQKWSMTGKITQGTKTGKRADAENEEHACMEERPTAM